MAKKTKTKSKKKAKSEASSWRAFEQLVARIEQVLCPKGAIVKSPDLLLDKITNEPREVDASIRYKIGTSELIITIECRERTKVQDTTWIEQLATKQQNIGASKTIAVTVNGFSEPAIKKAKLYGIEVRKVNKIDIEAIGKWIIVRVQINFHIVNITKISVDIKEELREAFVSELKSLKPNFGMAKVLIIRGEDNEVSLYDIFVNILDKNRTRIDQVNVPLTGHSEIIKLESQFPKGQIYFKTTMGNFDLVRLNVDFTLYRHSKKIMEQVSAFTYSDEKNDLVHGHEFEVTSSEGTKELVTIHTDIRDKTSKLSVWK